MTATAYARDPEQLYRAVYQRANGQLYGLTFAARSAEHAGRFADMWGRGNKCLTVRMIRPLQTQRPQLKLV